MLMLRFDEVSRRKASKASDPKVGSPSLRELAGIRKKFLQLGREIEEMPGGRIRDDLIHSKDKLGGFLSDAFGWAAWRHSDNK